MNKRSPFRRFVKALSDFGFDIAIRVAYSKLRGRLFPALALPDGPNYDVRRREVTVLVDAEGQDVATLEAIVEVVARRDASDWELCVCKRIGVRLEVERALTLMRGTQPWIRIVSADGSVDEATAAQWTVEQSTGEFVALLAPGCIVDVDAIAELLAQLRDDPGVQVAMLVEAEGGSASPSAPPRWGNCRLVLQRKSQYLEIASGRRWPLTAPALAKALDEAGARTAIIGARTALD